MQPEKVRKSEEVSQFLAAQNHPLVSEIELLRTLILAANANLNESIKWNGPNYTFEGKDRITMRIQPPKNLQIIFHRGAKVLEQPSQKLLAEDFGMLSWKGNDRAVATFYTTQDIEANKSNLQQIIQAWIAATE